MYTGSNINQDGRFSNKEKKFMKQLKFSETLNAKVDINKVKLDTIKPWIGKRITELLGVEDDVVEEFVNNQLEANTWPDPRKMQINLTGFLNGKNARVFMTELWELLLSAQESPSGIPPKFIEQKKQELIKEMKDKARMENIIKKIEKDREDRKKEEKKDSESKKSHSRSHTQNRRSKSRDRHHDKHDQEKEINKFKDPDSKKVQDKHTKRDSCSKSKEKLVSNGLIPQTKNEKIRSCSPKNDVQSTEEKTTKPKIFVSSVEGNVVETNAKPKPKEQSLTRDSTKYKKEKQRHSSSSSCSSSSSTSSSSPDRKKVFEIQKKENSNKNKRQYRNNKDLSSDSELNEDKSTDRRDHHDRLLTRSRRLSRCAFNHGHYREKNRNCYYRDGERERARKRERNRRDREWERRDRERAIHERDCGRDRRRRCEREERSSPRGRKLRSPERKSRSGSRRVRSCSKSKRRTSGKSCSRERIVKNSSIISSTKKDDTSKLKASQESLSRTPSPFMKVDDKTKHKPVKDRIVIDEQHSKSYQPQISKRQSLSPEKQNCNDKKNSSSSRPTSLTSLIIKKKEEENQKIKKSDTSDTENPRIKKKDESKSSDQSLKKNKNKVKRDSSSDDDKVKAKKRKLDDSSSSEDDVSKRKKKRKKRSSSLSSDESDRDEKKNKKDKRRKRHKKHKKHKKYTTEESDSDSSHREMLKQYLREIALHTLKMKIQS